MPLTETVWAAVAVGFTIPVTSKPGSLPSPERVNTLGLPAQCAVQADPHPVSVIGVKIQPEPLILVLASPLLAQTVRLAVMSSVEEGTSASWGAIVVVTVS